MYRFLPISQGLRDDSRPRPAAVNLSRSGAPPEAAPASSAGASSGALAVHNFTNQFFFVCSPGSSELTAVRSASSAVRAVCSLTTGSTAGSSTMRSPYAGKRSRIHVGQRGTAWDREQLGKMQAGAHLQQRFANSRRAHWHGNALTTLSVNSSPSKPETGSIGRGLWQRRMQCAGAPDVWRSRLAESSTPGPPLCIT